MTNTDQFKNNNVADEWNKNWLIGEQTNYSVCELQIPYSGFLTLNTYSLPYETIMAKPVDCELISLNDLRDLL